MTSRWVLGLAAIVALLCAAAAQEPPTHGCGAAVSCQPLGFSTLGTNPNAVTFGGFRFGASDVHFYVVTPRSRPNPEEYSVNDVRVFHLRNVSLLPRTPSPTPFSSAAPGVTPPPPSQ